MVFSLDFRVRLSVGLCASFLIRLFGVFFFFSNGKYIRDDILFKWITYFFSNIEYFFVKRKPSMARKRMDFNCRNLIKFFSIFDCKFLAFNWKPSRKSRSYTGDEMRRNFNRNAKWKFWLMRKFNIYTRHTAASFVREIFNEKGHRLCYSTKWPRIEDHNTPASFSGMHIS